MAHPVLDPGDAAWTDDRGWGLRIADAGVPFDRVREAHAVSVGHRAVRGNHLHPDATEWMVVLGGPFTVAWRGPDGARGESRIAAGEGASLFVFEPGVAHAVRWEGEGEGLLLCLSDVAEPTTERAEALL